jgi:L-ornithine N5-monooxygenase
MNAPLPPGTTSKAQVIDVVGIGFGPANIALAIAAQELASPLEIRFLERNSGPGWQEEMLLPESDIQNHPLRDLVTPRNPRSRYTFVNFLFEQGRLFEHLNLPLSHPLRLEYRQYVMWVAQQFEHQVEYGCTVAELRPVVEAGALVAYDVVCASGRVVRARSVVLGPGRTPYLPPEFEALMDERIVHLTQFGSAFRSVAEKVVAPRVAIVGGSQTAVELLLHSSDHLPAGGSTVGITRNFGFRLKDTSPFSDEVYFPKFVDTFFHATKEDKERLRRELVFTNYSASDRDVIDALYVKLYKNRLLGRTDLRVHTLTTVSQVSAGPDGVELTLTHGLRKTTELAQFDLVVLATGFKDLGDGPGKEAFPSLMSGLTRFVDLSTGMLGIDLDYRVRFCDESHAYVAPFYLNGLCESSHGMGDAGSFSLLSLRSATIVESLQRRLELPASVPAASQSLLLDTSSTGLITAQTNVSLHPVP